MDTNYELTDGRPTLRLERRLAHPVGAVWTAISDPRELAQWFPSTIDGDLRQGSRLSFSFPEYDEVPDMEGRVTAFDPPRELGFDWGSDHVRFELAPAGEHTDLRLTVRLDSRGQGRPRRRRMARVPVRAWKRRSTEPARSR